MDLDGEGKKVSDSSVSVLMVVFFLPLEEVLMGVRGVGSRFLLRVAGEGIASSMSTVGVDSFKALEREERVLRRG